MSQEKGGVTALSAGIIAKRANEEIRHKVPPLTWAVASLVVSEAYSGTKTKNGTGIPHHFMTPFDASSGKRNTAAPVEALALWDPAHEEARSHFLCQDDGT